MSSSNSFFQKPRALLKPVAAALLGAFLLQACTEAAAPNVAQGAAPAPVEVGVVTLAPQQITLNTELPGRTVAWQLAEIRPQVGGIILKRLFTEGADVKAGDTLYQIDPATFAAAKQSAAAALARANANLQQAAAKASRYQKMIQQRLISQQDFDEVAAQHEQAKADVLAAKAQLQSAQIQLDYSKVTAPINGRIGKSAVTAGALVSANQAQALAVVQQLDPIYVEVTQSSAELLKLKQALASGALGAAGTAVSLQLEDGSTYQHKGRLQFSEVSVDASTGSVVLRAEFANPDQLLLPGMYVRATLETGINTAAILAPQRGISRNAKGEATALVVNAAGTVEPRLVKASRTVSVNGGAADQWLVEEGLAAGDQLIVEGLQKVRPGAPAKAVPFNAAVNSATATNPAPAGQNKATGAN
ncbi:efflux RND transporter periplasmic adaptor subunit [Rheinheimera riviphila]|uniref:Efflux RND transporter periplasmic adaptor subunit n=1 Tax=Rheinheimera riviphila TaxID=1834037 RepID=A0A437R0D5_9GAMM|nr:efflux RND transporter periplasmic adaptor subunit [Rheinheimera riviphila]RVU40218.1 efflux RND transporter periplasmic adaptor subunit [Rheinheimera riviphila]